MGGEGGEIKGAREMTLKSMLEEEDLQELSEETFVLICELVKWAKNVTYLLDDMSDMACQCQKGTGSGICRPCRIRELLRQINR